MPPKTKALKPEDNSVLPKAPQQVTPVPIPLPVSEEAQAPVIVYTIGGSIRKDS